MAYRLENWSLNAYGDKETITGEIYDHPDFRDGQTIVTGTLVAFDLVDIRPETNDDDPCLGPTAIDADDVVYYLGKRYSRDDTNTIEVTISTKEEEKVDKLAEGFSGKPIC